MSNGDIQHAYDIDSLNLFMTVLCSLGVGVGFCIPIVVLALDLTSRQVDVVLIIFFVLVLGCASAWWERKPLIAVTLMIAYAAVLANVNV